MRAKTKNLTASEEIQTVHSKRKVGTYPNDLKLTVTHSSISPPSIELRQGACGYVRLDVKGLKWLIDNARIMLASNK